MIPRDRDAAQRPITKKASLDRGMFLSLKGRGDTQPCSSRVSIAPSAESVGCLLRVNNGYGGRSTSTSVVPPIADDFGAPRKSAEVGRFCCKTIFGAGTKNSFSCTQIEAGILIHRTGHFGFLLLPNFPGRALLGDFCNNIGHERTCHDYPCAGGVHAFWESLGRGRFCRSGGAKVRR
jgi:hypothetical protein